MLLLLTFSLWSSLRRCVIFTLTASSSSSATCGTARGSASSGAWRRSSLRGTYHLQSYCWFFLQDGAAPLIGKKYIIYIHTNIHVYVIHTHTHIKIYIYIYG